MYVNVLSLTQSLVYVSVGDVELSWAHFLLYLMVVRFT